MFTPTERQLELLSGLLDGMLDDSERLELEKSMRSHPELANSLEELSSLRRSLLRGRPVARLGDAFTKRVVEQAVRRKNAVELESQRDDVDITLAETQSNSSRRTWYTGLAVLAASFVVIAVTINAWMVKPPIGDDIIVLVPGTTEPRETESDPKSVTDVPPTALVLENPERIETSTPSQSKVAQADPKEMDTNPVDSSNAMVAANPGNAAADKLPTIDKNILKKNGLTFALVFDISIDSVARENDALRSILDSHDIVYTNDLNLDAKQLDALASTRVVKVSNELKGSDADESVDVYILSAVGNKLMPALMDIMHQTKDFPEVSFDMVTGAGIRTLIDQMGGSLADGEEQGSIAQFSHGDHIKRFESNGRRGSLIAADRRLTMSGIPLLVEDTKKPAYVLLLIRNAK